MATRRQNGTHIYCSPFVLLRKEETRFARRMTQPVYVTEIAPECVSGALMTVLGGAMGSKCSAQSSNRLLTSAAASFDASRATQCAAER